jgi:hypothetical protein
MFEETPLSLTGLTLQLVPVEVVLLARGETGAHEVEQGRVDLGP